MKKEIWFSLIFVLSFCFYYTGTVGSTCTIIEKMGFVGMHVLIFLFLYYIVCIYVFHIEKLKGSYKKGKITYFNLILAFIPPFFPVLLLGALKTDCHFNLELVSLITLLPLLILLMDGSGSIREKIVEDFEARTNGNGGDLFFHYPPRRIDDIYFKVLIFLLLFFMLIIINFTL
jgi:hypothetical protein